MTRQLVVGALCAIGLIVGATLVLGGSDDGYIVKATFDDAGGVRKNSDVKVGEVPAGKVTGVDLTKGDKAIITMKLDEGVGPIGAGASAQSRPVNLLGEKYVDLEPGNLRSPMSSGTTIPAQRTRTAVELDDILNTLEPDTRARLRILINETGVAMAGRGADFNRLLEQMPSGLHEATTFLDALSSDTHKLAGLLEKGDRVLAAVSGRREDLGRLVDSADDALKVTASRRNDLGRTLASAPAGLTELRGTLTQLQRTAEDLRPAAANLRATSQPLADTLRRLPAFAGDAEGALAEVTRVAPALNRLGVKGAPTVRRLRPTLDHLADFTGELGPLVRELSDGGGVRNLVRFANNWAGLTSLQDGISHLFRVRLLAGPDAITSDGAPKDPARRRRPASSAPRPAPSPSPSPVKPQQAAPKLPDLPSLELPDLPGIINDATKKLLGEAPAAELDKLLGRDAGGNDGTAALLDYLLGN